MDEGFYQEIEENDCISSLALRYGLFWETIWNHPNNLALKQLRENPNTLLAGDRVFIPAIQIKEEQCAAQQRHRFVRKGVPALLRLFLKEGSAPRAGVRFVLVIDGESREGRTDSQGMILENIAPDAQRGLLTLFEGDRRESIALRFGAMDPVTESSGVAKRLRNLGFLGDDDSPEALREALHRFQVAQGLPVTEELDATLRDALSDAHRS